MDLHDPIAPRSSTSPAWPTRWRGPVPCAEPAAIGDSTGAGGSGPAAAPAAPSAPAAPAPAQPAPAPSAPEPSLKDRLGADRKARLEAEAAERKALTDRLAALEAREAAREKAEQERVQSQAKAELKGKIDGLLEAAKIKARFRSVALEELGDIGDPTSPEAKAKVDAWATKNTDLVDVVKPGPLTPPAPPAARGDGRPRGRDFMPLDMAAHRAATRRS